MAGVSMSRVPGEASCRLQAARQNAAALAGTSWAKRQTSSLASGRTRDLVSTPFSRRRNPVLSWDAEDRAGQRRRNAEDFNRR
jgi:hypothetical protein